MNKTQLKFAFQIIAFFLMANLTAQISNDSIPPLHYPFNANQEGSLYLSDFDNYEVIFDADRNRYVVVSLIGSYEIRFPIVMTSRICSISFKKRYARLLQRKSQRI